MRLTLRALLCYRPRVLTLIVLVLIGAILLLANLSDDVRQRSPTAVSPTGPWHFDVREGGWAPLGFGAFNLSYGWPLLWKQLIIYGPYGVIVVGWRYSAGRLAANVAIWLVMLAVPGIACEWTLRRYQPRLRFSVRAMLGAVSVVALFLGWFAWARDRANREDALIDTVNEQHGQVWLERWGPKWLDLFGADRYRRRIVATKVNLSWPDDVEDDTRSAQELFRQLSQLPNLEYLLLGGNNLTPEIANALSDFPQLHTLSIESSQVLPGAMHALSDALGRMPRLRVLSISPGDACYDFGGDLDKFLQCQEQMWDECLTAVGKASRLKSLHLCGMIIRPKRLHSLAPLTELKTLSLENVDGMTDEPNPPPLLSGLPVLPQLEAFDMDCSGIGRRGTSIGDEDLQYLARLPHLKSLRLVQTDVTGAGLSHLASLKYLEELSLSTGTGELMPYRMSSEGLLALRVVERLKRLHIPVEFKQPAAPNLLEFVPSAMPEDHEACVRALEALGRAHPGIVIDGDWTALARRETKLLPNGCDTRDRLQTEQWRAVVQKWNAAGSPPMWQVK